MRPFRAWWLPSGFELRPEEVVVREEGEGRPFVHGVLSSRRLAELTALLRANRSASLVSFPVARIVRSVDGVARRLLDGKDPLRREALETLGSFSGFSGPMAGAVLSGMAKGWTEESLEALIRRQFPNPAVLDGFAAGEGGGGSRALGYPLTFHLGAGSVPGVATTSLVRALLVKSAVFLRPGSGDLGLPTAFLKGLEAEDEDLAQNAAVMYWPVDALGQTETLLGEADLVVAYGNDETVQWVRRRLPVTTPLVAYRHRMGFGLVGRAALRRGSPGGDAEGARETARDVARAVALFDQQGCVSPQVLFVERGGEVEPHEWADLLARALEELEAELPSGTLSPENGAAIQQLRGAAEMDESRGEGSIRHGGEEAPWTVLHIPDGAIEPSCQHRTVRVIPVDAAQQAVRALEDWGRYLQTVGVVGSQGWSPEILEDLARLGVSRISPMAGVPWPPSWWHHDGSDPLRDLVRWTDLEDPNDLS